MDDTTAPPLADRGAPRAAAANLAIDEPAPAWPILARFAEIAELDPPTAKSETPSYRVDAPHAAAPPVHSTPQVKPLQRSGESKPSADTAERQERVLAFAPLPIRLTVQAWRLMQPYLGIIRFAAMLILMAIGGTSMSLMMGGFWHPAATPPSPNTTAVDHTSALEVEPTTIEPVLRLDAATPPEAKSTSIAPTAIGPAETPSKPVMAIESTDARTDTAAPLATLPSPAEETDTPAAPTASAIAATTRPLPPSEPWPKVQTGEPAVARLSGVVVETETR
jgi:hypothetical protein